MIVTKEEHKKKSSSRGYEIPTPEGLAVYPSVTTILDILDKPALKFWAVNCVLEYITSHFEDIKAGKIGVDDIDLDKAKAYHKEKSEEAANIGTQVHNTIEAQIKASLAGIPKTKAILDTPEARSSYSAFIQWCKDTGFKPLAAEVVVYSHKYKFAGTLDCLGLINGKVYVLDWKTSKAHYGDMATQISAYGHALTEMIESGDIDLPIPEGIGVLRLDKETGIPDWRDYSEGRYKEYYEKHWEAFKGLLGYYYKSKKRKTGHVIPHKKQTEKEK